MKISYNWLKNYVDFNLTPQDLGEVLTGVGLEVEDISRFESIPGGLEGVVVGEVKECTKHPDADKLSVTKVDVGKGELLQIVCGAPNVAAGQKVAVAVVGAVLQNVKGEKLAIKKAKIRGIESMGMICAEDELGLSENHDGIMVLGADTAVGTRAADYFKVEKDFVFEIGLTPNRGDANSHIGVARDVAAALNVTYKAKVHFSKPDLSKTILPATTPAVQVDVQDAKVCSRYSALSLSNVTVADSPEWLKNKLKAIGLRSINNVVDVTNYVLHEYGQPLHAFDADKIRGNKVVVQKAGSSAKPFKGLDGNEYAIQSDDLMICDVEGPMCIAGVFGGAESGVTASTKNIFLESAHFHASSIRKTGTRLNLRTDAATHFEKGTDPNATVDALLRAAGLLTEICGAKISSGLTDIYPHPVEGWRFSVSYSRMLRLAGFEIEAETVRALLGHLEIKIEKEEGDEWHLLVPAFKTEVTREADVVEEIVRILGYNSFPLPKGLRTSLAYSPKVNAQQIENTIADMLCGAGFNEIWTNSVTNSTYETNEQLKAQQVKLLNSQTAELDSLRSSMLYSGLEVIAYNQNRKANDLRLFEFGKTYLKAETSYTETRHLQILLSGKTAEDNWLAKGTACNFYHLKSVVFQLLRRLGHSNLEIKVVEEQPFDFALCLQSEGVEIGRLGKVNNPTLKKFEIKQAVFFADLQWSYLLEKSAFHKISFTELPKFPSVKRDLAMVLQADVSFEAVEKIAKAEGKKLLQEISLFDVYRGDKMEPGKKSYAVSFVFQHSEKTMTDSEIEKVMSRLMHKFETELGAVIRKA